MAKKNVNALGKASDIEKKIQEYMKQKEALLKKVQTEIGEYVLAKWNVEDNLDKVYEAIDLLRDEAIVIINNPTSSDKKGKDLSDDETTDKNPLRESSLQE